MKLNKKTIDQSIKNGERNNYFDNLNKIYDTIPFGVCQGCTKCCMESVNTFYIEYLNIYINLKENTVLYEELLPKIFRYYFLEMVEKMTCPFLSDDGLCVIYEFRPLACRLFGYWSEAEYEQNYKRVIQENKGNYKYFRNTFGIEIPKDVINYKIKYCKAFEMDRNILKKERQSMVDSMFSMDSNFFMKGLITEDFIHIPLVSWFIYTYFDMDEAGELRVKIMREYLKDGESETLEKIISKI